MNRIKEARIQKQMNQDDLAKLLNCSSVTISRYETGAREIDSETINRLCDILGCTSDYLIGRTDIPKPQISEEDAEFLRLYHAAPHAIRQSVETILRESVPQAKSEVS